MTTTYAFAAAEHIDEQLALLEACLDPVSVAQLERLGVGPGWRCLEVGAGGGSVARWLAERVGPSGHVTATDLDISHLRVGDRVRVLRHDISAEELPEGPWDLIHARLVLQHLPARRELVAKLAAGLRPGGWLLVEDFDCRHLPVAAAPDAASAELFTTVVSAILAVLEAAGADLSWGMAAYAVLRAEGLCDVAADARTAVWSGGTPGCLLYATNARQLADRLHHYGADCSTVERFRALMADPAFAAPSYLLVSTRGRRP